MACAKYTSIVIRLEQKKNVFFAELKLIGTLVISRYALCVSQNIKRMVLGHRGKAL